MRVVLADPPMSDLVGMAATESPNLGILFLISYARELLPNIKFTYLEPFLSEEQHLKRVKEINPDVYGISFTTMKKDLAYSTIRKVKQDRPSTFVISGGTQPTVDPVQTMRECPEIDVCVKGEGERTFSEILKFYPRFQNLEGLCYQTRSRDNRIVNNANREPLSNIDFFPAWDLVDLRNYDIAFRRNYPIAYVLPCRGCHNNCVFCSQPVWKQQKPWVRLRSPKNVADEIELLYSRGAREIYIRADTFNVDIDWTMKVCKEIKKRKLDDMTFQCQLRSDKVPRSLVKKLSEIHCWLVHIGIESANDRVLRGIRKNTTIENTTRIIKLLREDGIEVYGFFMQYNVWESENGLEYETPEEVETTLQYARFMLDRELLNYISWSMTNPLAGSELHKIAQKYRLFNKKSLSEGIEGWRFVGMKLPNIPEKTMLAHLRRGLSLQLMNGFKKDLFTKSPKRALDKFHSLLEILEEEENQNLKSGN